MELLKSKSVYVKEETKKSKFRIYRISGMERISTIHNTKVV